MFDRASYGTLNKLCICIALHCIALHCVALRCIALHCIALHCIALHCIALHCIREITTGCWQREPLSLTLCMVCVESVSSKQVTHVSARSWRMICTWFQISIIDYKYIKSDQCNHKPTVFDTRFRIFTINIPANTKHLYSICPTSAQRLRRWSNIVQILYKCFVFTVIPMILLSAHSLLPSTSRHRQLWLRPRLTHVSLV